jgi:transposase
LDRLDPVLPLSPGRAERHGFEYFRHGTLSLYAALNTASGEVIGKTASRHTSTEFVCFLDEVVASVAPGKQIHIIADNLSAHKTQAVRVFLSDHSTVQLHFTATYSSWLNQVEIWFSKIQRDLIARGIFTSKANLARQIMRYIRHYNKAALPFKWSYRNTAKRIRSLCSLSSVTLH